MAIAPAYSFCESTWATGRSPWHIRQLSVKGHKFGGGADTLSLCGRSVAWDIQVPVSKHHVGQCCPECRTAYVAAMRRR
jgi:hypothetical protein